MYFFNYSIKLEKLKKLKIKTKQKNLNKIYKMEIFNVKKKIFFKKKYINNNNNIVSYNNHYYLFLFKFIFNLKKSGNLSFLKNK
ncbi:MAG: hypothetical protein ACLGGV_10325, partial [Bacteroidia bacterium]